jgi:flagellar assembly factor FliW
MKCSEKTEFELLPVKPENVIEMPMGLLGFEATKKYVLLSNPDEAPFLWLQVLEDPQLAFLVMPPSILFPTYQPEIGPDDVKVLGLKGPEDALVLNIVTLRPGGRATLNLKGPIILNRRSLVGKQVVPVNALHYNLQHPLPVDRGVYP